MKMLTDQQRAILRNAADIIEANGWYQGGYAPGVADDDVSEAVARIRAGAPCCAAGAIMAAASELPMDIVLPIVAERVGSPVPNWNDHSTTSEADVIEVLRELAGE